MPAIENGPPTDREWKYVLVHPHGRVNGDTHASHFRYYDKPDVLSRRLEWNGQPRHALFLLHDDQRMRAWKLGWEDITEAYKADPAEPVDTAAVEHEAERARALEDQDLAQVGKIAIDDNELSMIKLLQRMGPQQPSLLMERLSLTTEAFDDVVQRLTDKDVIRRVGSGKKTVLALNPDAPTEAPAPSEV
jgi:hypothetical protein